MQKYLGLVILFCLLLAPPARAADPYVVTGIQADVTAATAAKARDEAIKQASHKAFEALSQQIFPGKPVPKLSDKTIGNMISDFHVEQEQAAANRYVATFTFRFRQNPVRAAFGTRAIPSPRELAGGASGDIAQDDGSIGQIIAGEKPIGDDADPDESVSVLPIPGNSILVEVTAHNSRELDQALARFKNIDDVREIQYVSITPENSILRLSYAGEPDHLLGDMRAHGVSLRADTGTEPPLYVLEP